MQFTVVYLSQSGRKPHFTLLNATLQILVHYIRAATPNKTVFFKQMVLDLSTINI